MTAHKTSKAAAASGDAALQDPVSFEAIVARLEHIAGHLETGDAKLEEALALFEEGVALSKQGAQRLDAAERKLERLLESGGTEPIAESHIAPPGEGF